MRRRKPSSGVTPWRMVGLQLAKSRASRWQFSDGFEFRHLPGTGMLFVYRNLLDAKLLLDPPRQARPAPYCWRCLGNHW